MGTSRLTGDGRGGGRRRTRRLGKGTAALGFLLAGALTVTLLPDAGAVALDKKDFKVRPVQRTASVPGTAIGSRHARAAVSDTDRKPWRPGRTVWPAAGETRVDLTAVAPAALARSAAGKSVYGLPHAEAKGMPLRFAPLTARKSKGRTTPEAVPDRIRVRTTDRGRAAGAGVDGVLVGVARDDGTAAPGRASVQLDYTAFRDAYGADWSSRLRLVQLPSCALTQPDKASCRVPEPLPTHNDSKAGTLTAEVALAADASAFTVLAVTASSEGGNGDFKATSLSPSGSWSAGGNEGGFTWQYPLAVPPVPGDLTPKLGLGYSSSSIDGRTAATNNQSSAVGEGWSMELGFIERQYMSCKDDNATGSNAGTKSGDLCWKSDNAVLSLNGSSTPLVRVGTSEVWKPADDDGSRVERVRGTSADTANGDDDNEYWKVTTLDGTQYFFGRNRLPGWVAGKPETGSAFTTPVFGNHAGEPGHATAFADSWRNQAWRWNLDYVVDPHGNAMALFYDKETNAYAKNSGGEQTSIPKADVTYVRGGLLNRIEYGHRAGQVHAFQPAARVLFGTADRCLGSTADCAFDKAHAANWPDTPVDQVCEVGKDCMSGSPTFWSRKRLTSVTTQALKAGVFVDVDTWTFTHQFPGTGDAGGADLWLASVVRTGKAGGTALSTPAVTFGGTLMPNRVDAAEGRPPLNKYRITRISSESGADTLVTYSPTECVYSAPPAAETNTKRCYPAWWTPEGGTEPVKDWFHKYVVTKVVEDDKVADTDSAVTEYEYLGGIAWAKDTSEFTLEKHRTHGDFRGYAKVRTRTGAENRTLEETVFLRGIEGATVTDSAGRTHSDAEPYAGMELESAVYDKDGGSPVVVSTSEPWSRETASMKRTGTTDLKAYQADTRVVSTRTLLSDGTWRTTRLTNSFDEYGQTVTSSDEGDLAVSGDEMCTRTTHTTPDTTNWLIAYIASEQKTSAACGTPAAPANIIGETRTTYDNGAFGAAPVAGKANPSRIEELDRFGLQGDPVFVTTATAVHDAMGRRVEDTDAAGARSVTAYTPASGAQPTQVKTTNAKGHVTYADLDGLRGLTVKATDANGRVTHQDYNSLGRLVAAWKPGRAKTAPADVTFSYLVRNTGPTTVTSRTLLENGQYRTAVTLYDGMLRRRQTQTDAHGGTGRLVSDTFYDSHGRAWKTNGEYYNDQPTGSSVHAVADNVVPSQTVTEFDGQGRPTASVLLSKGVEKWRSTTSYGGNWTATVPPVGGTAVLTVVNAHDKPVELREYKDRNPVLDASADRYESVKYGYDSADRLTKVVDEAGNTWTAGYDLRGRKVQSSDPDKGTVTTTYRADGLVATTTDARKQTLAYTYDDLGRATSLRKDDVNGTALAEWTYDTLPGGVGKLTKSVRYENGNAYTTAVKGYDTAGHATGSVITVPAAEGKLAGTYEFANTYTPNTGLAATTSYPAGGGLPAETVRHGYTTYGLPATVGNGTDVYSLGTQYSPFGEVLQTVLGDIGGRVVQTFSYEDATRRLAGVVNDREADGPQTIDNKTYTYDPSGNITRIRNDRDDKAVTDTQCFTHDFAARLTNAWTGTDDCALKPSTDVRPQVGGVSPYWYSYTYDAVGNRTSEVRHAPSGDTAEDVTRTYAYPGPGGDRPHAMEQVAVTGSGARTDTFEYDASGNTTRRVTTAGDQSITWDAEGRMASSTVGGKTSTFLYDADGTRLLRRDPGAVTLYLGSQELRLDTAKATVSGLRYYPAGKATVTRSSDGSVSYLLGDHHGTDEVTVDAATLSYQRRDHGPFGTPRGTQPAAGSWPGERGFVGGTNDASTGLTHVGAREYDAANGKFISADPVMNLSDPQQLNAYSYANNSPVTDADPSGEWSLRSMLRMGAAFARKSIRYARPAFSIASPASRALRTHTFKFGRVYDRYDAAKRVMLSEGGNGTKFGKFNVGKGEDRGIIMMRFYIHTKKAVYTPLGALLLGDDRTFSVDPDAPYRMVLFWDTASGDVTFKVSASHTNSFTMGSFKSPHAPPRKMEAPSISISAQSLLFNANPENTWKSRKSWNVLNYSSYGHSSTPDKLDLGLHGVNSLIRIFAVDNDVTIAANKSSVTVTRSGDPYPDMEVVQYRRNQPPQVIAQDRMANEDGLDSKPTGRPKIDRSWTDGKCTSGC
ncbi:RHS repeat-associated core domain-containing protein [Streptomyces sannanensis]|uniref:RHS repeat-associated core domain-containing protein n=1 Tax=Streptomyces sannanensis TaxID=285536 RepID=UPI0031EA0577